jgi:hypothetical protein
MALYVSLWAFSFEVLSLSIFYFKLFYFEL